MTAVPHGSSLVFLGIDGGQSSTTALIGDEQGRIIGYGRGGPCNHIEAAGGRAKFVKAIAECLSAACQQAGLNPARVRFAAACLGFSGGPADKEAILREMLVTDRMSVTHDGLIALVGATAGDPGAIIIAGTGSLAFGRNAAGRIARAGGWGYVFGDEGSGFDLTRQALRAVLRGEEGWGQPTALCEKLLEATGAADANDLLHRFYTSEYPRPRVAAFSQLVDEAAENGDSIAREILQHSARELVNLVSAVCLQLFTTAVPYRISYIGGVFRSRLLLDEFRSVAHSSSFPIPQAPLLGPAAGALLEAYRIAGMHPSLADVPEFEK